MRVALCYNKKPENINSYKNKCEKNYTATLNNTNEAYAEYDDDHTINAITKALNKFHHTYHIEADQYAYLKFLDIRPDIVFNIAEGLKGPFRESAIPSMLEFLQIPYTGSDSLTLSICLDKVLTKQILTLHHIPTPEFYLVSSDNSIPSITKSWELYPCIVKPLHEGSSIGIWNESVVENPNQLAIQLSKMIERYNQPVVIERLLPGREFTIGLLGNGDRTTLLPPVEVSFDKLPDNAKPIYSYEAKWMWDTPHNPLDIFKCPANIDEPLFKKIKETALQAFKALKCKDWARIDIRLDKNGIPNILEINPLPGILPNAEDNSCMPKAAKAAGLTYDDLILKVLNIACERYNITTGYKLLIQ